MLETPPAEGVSNDRISRIPKHIISSLVMPTHSTTLATENALRLPRYPENLQPIAFGESFYLNLKSQIHLSLFNRMWQKRPGKLP